MQKRIEIQYHKTNLGEFILGNIDQSVCLLDYRWRKRRSFIDQRIRSTFNADFFECNNPLLREVKTQIDAYLKGDLKTFQFPICLDGSDFQKNVWKTLEKIPYGKTKSYLQISEMMGVSSSSVRAVANANGANAIALAIPCHRVIGSDGSLVGYAGGLQAKKKLLGLEKRNTFYPNELPLWD